MANEYKLSYTAQEIDEKLGKIATPDWEQNDPDVGGYIENKPFYEKIDVVTHLVTPREVECFSGENAGMPGYVVAQIELDSRTDINFANTMIPEHGGDFYLEIDGEQTLISLEADEDNYYDECRFYFGNKSMMNPDLPNTGENFFGQLYVTEDYEYINNQHYDFNILQLGVAFESDSLQHTIGLRYVDDKIVLGYLPEGEEFEDDYEDNEGNYMYYQEFEPFGNLFSSFEDYADTVNTLEEYFELYNKLFRFNLYYGDEVYENFDWSLYNYVDDGYNEWMIYFGNINIYHSAGPDTGESFVFLPEWDGYPTILSRDNISPMIKFELAELPKISNIKKIDSKFLPSIYVQKGQTGAAEDAAAIGARAIAGNDSLSVEGQAYNTSIAIGPYSVSNDYSVAINPNLNYDQSFFVTFETIESGKLKIISSKEYETRPLTSFLQKTNSILIKFLKSDFENEEYYKPKLYSLDIESKNEDDSKIEIITAYNYNIREIPLKDSANSCEIFISDFANYHSILLGNGIANKYDFISNADSYGEQNIAINNQSQTTQIISGKKNISLNGQGNIDGDNNVNLNSSAEIAGNNNIQISSNVPIGNNSIYLGTGNEEPVSKVFSGRCDYHAGLGRYQFELNVFAQFAQSLDEIEVKRIYKLSESQNLSGGGLYYLDKIEDSELYFYSVKTGELYNPTYGYGYGSYPYFGLVNHSSSNNAIAIGQSAYTITDNQVVLGKHPNVQPDTGFAVGMGEDTQNRKNLFEVSKDGNMQINSIVTGGLDIRNTNNEASYTSQDCMVLRDIDTGWEYAYQMKSGALVTTLLPTHIEVTKLPTKLEYEQGDSLDPIGMEITAFYPDGHIEIIENFDILPVNNKEFFYNLGINYVSIRAKLPLTYLTQVEVNVVEFDYESALIDFNYTVNPDGTITLNSWKQTLNGVQSTEMVIPNNGLIIV